VVRTDASRTDAALGLGFTADGRHEPSATGVLRCASAASPVFFIAVLIDVGRLSDAEEPELQNRIGVLSTVGPV